MLLLLLVRGVVRDLQLHLLMWLMLMQMRQRLLQEVLLVLRLRLLLVRQPRVLPLLAFRIFF